jgi:hypothetical protein
METLFIQTQRNVRCKVLVTVCSRTQSLEKHVYNVDFFGTSCFKYTLYLWFEKEGHNYSANRTALIVRIFTTCL